MASLFTINPDGSLLITLPPPPVAASAKIPAGTLAAMPASPSAGDAYIAIDQPAGQQLYICGAPGVWTQMLNLGGSGALALDKGSLDINLATMPMLPRENTFTGLNHFHGDVDFTGKVTGLPTGTTTVVAVPPITKIWAGAASAIAQPVIAKIDSTLTFEKDLPGTTPGLHTSPSQFTIPAAGVYRGYAQIRSFPSGGAVYLTIRRNGVEIADNGWAGGPQGGPALQTVFSLPFAAGDILTVVAASWTPFNVESAVFAFEN